MESYDAIVVGVGSMGGAALAELADRGIRSLGLEAFRPGHDQGSAHGGSRIVRQAYFEGAAYVPLLQRAYEGWRRLEAETGADLLRLTGGLWLGDESSRTASGSLEAAREHGLPHEVLEPEAIRERFPTFQVRDDQWALFEPNAGYARPEATTIANAELAVRRGAKLRTGERVESWSVTPNGGVEVRTREGVVGADLLVVTAGARSAELLPGLDTGIRAQRQIMHWFTPDYTALPPAAWDQRNHPVYIEETESRDEMYGFPATDGPEGGFKLGFFRSTEVVDPDAVRRTVSPDEVSRMRRRALQTFPHLTGPHLRSVVCLYETTADGHAVIGRHPGHENVTIAGGFSGHGFKFVPVVGEVVADLALEGRSAFDLEMFSPSRPGLRWPEDERD